MEAITVIAATAGWKVNAHAEAIRRTRNVLPLSSRGLLLSTQPPTFDFGGTWVELPSYWCPRGTWGKTPGPNGEWNHYEYSRFMLFGLVDYIETRHCIVCQHDGYGIQPQNWRNEFLHYDYIGAPWPAKMNVGRVGNGGFSLRSRRWLECASSPLRSPPFDSPNVHGSEDCYFCTVYRDFYERSGMKIAPVAVAARWSLEHPVEEHPRRTATDCFGFHGAFTPETKKLIL